MAVRLLSSDLDGTLAGDRASSARFRRAWEALPAATRPLLVYNSGRLVDDVLAFTAAEGLPQADLVIGGVGTGLHGVTQPAPAEAFGDYLARDWSLSAVEALIAGHPRIRRQPDRYQHALKSSWYLHDAEEEELAAIEASLSAAGLPARLIYSSARDLDILPLAAGKGSALAFLCRHLGIALAEVVVAGDSGNDSAMFALPQVRGILVGNALPELEASTDPARTYRAGADRADGVLEGLRAFGLPVGETSMSPGG